MNKRMIVWFILFAAGLLMVLCRMEISPYVSDLTGLLVGGSILAVTAGAGMLLEIYSVK